MYTIEQMIGMFCLGAAFSGFVGFLLGRHTSSHMREDEFKEVLSKIKKAEFEAREDERAKLLEVLTERLKSRKAPVTRHPEEDHWEYLDGRL